MAALQLTEHPDDRLSLVAYACRHETIGAAPGSSASSSSYIASISDGSPGRTYVFPTAKPGAPPNGLTSGRLPSGRCAHGVT